MEKAISTLSKLDTHYQNAQVTKKREIVSSIFHGNSFLTERIIELSRLIKQLNLSI